MRRSVAIILVGIALLVFPEPVTTILGLLVIVAGVVDYFL